MANWELHSRSHSQSFSSSEDTIRSLNPRSHSHSASLIPIREPSPNPGIRVSRFSEEYGHVALNPSRDPSPAGSLNTRVSRFAEMYGGYDTPLNYKDSTIYAQPEHYDRGSNDKETLLMPATRPERSHSAGSDSERLLSQARENADAEAGAYREQRRKAMRTAAPPPELSKTRRVYVTRLVLRILVTMVSVAIIIVLLDAIRTYDKTKDAMQTYSSGSERFKVWPEGLEVSLTMFMLIAAFVAAGLSSVLCLASLNQEIRRMTKTGNIMTMVISAVSLALWIAITAYYASWDTKETNWDLLSWACKHLEPEYNYQNINFGETCTEMRFALWSAVALAAMELINLLLFAAWLIRAIRARKPSRV